MNQIKKYILIFINNMLIGKYNMNDIENINLDDVFETKKKSAHDLNEFDDYSTDDKLLNNKDIVMANYRNQKNKKNTQHYYMKKSNGCKACNIKIANLKSSSTKKSKKSKRYNKLISLLFVILMVLTTIITLIMIPNYYKNKSFLIANTITWKITQFKNVLSEYYKKITIKPISN